MVKNELTGTIAKVTGGAVTYVGSYAVLDNSLTVAHASEIAALVAASLTALYFGMQFLYTTWKWRQEFNEMKRQRGKKHGQ